MASLLSQHVCSLFWANFFGLVRPHPIPSSFMQSVLGLGVCISIYANFVRDFLKCRVLASYRFEIGLSYVVGLLLEIVI